MPPWNGMILSEHSLFGSLLFKAYISSHDFPPILSNGLFRIFEPLIIAEELPIENSQLYLL